jgi:hypothetical protein
MPRLIGIVLVLMLAACAMPRFGAGSPPGARLNDTTGRTVSYCWSTQFVDGVVTPDAPLFPRPVSLQFDQPPTQLELFVRRGATQNFAQQPVTVTDGKIGSLPAGHWDCLLAMARFRGGDVMYAWRLR